MGIDQDIARAHERGHAHRVAGIVGERQEGRAKRGKAAMQTQAVGDRGHGELAYAVVDVVAAVVAGADRHMALEIGAVRPG